MYFLNTTSFTSRYRLELVNDNDDDDDDDDGDDDGDDADISL